MKLRSWLFGCKYPVQNAPTGKHLDPCLHCQKPPRKRIKRKNKQNPIVLRFGAITESEKRKELYIPVFLNKRQVGFLVRKGQRFPHWEYDIPFISPWPFDNKHYTPPKVEPVTYMQLENILLDCHKRVRALKKRQWEKHQRGMS